MCLPCCITHRCARQCFQRHSGRKSPPHRRGDAPDAASYRSDRPEDEQITEGKRREGTEGCGKRQRVCSPAEEEKKEMEMRKIKCTEK